MGNKEDKVKIINPLVHLVIFGVPRISDHYFMEKIFPEENSDLEHYIYEFGKFKVKLENCREIGDTEFELKILSPYQDPSSKGLELIEKADAIIFMLDLTDKQSYKLVSERIAYFQKNYDIQNYDITILANAWEESGKIVIQEKLAEEFANSNKINYKFASTKEQIKNYLINKVIFHENIKIESQMNELNKKRKGAKKEKSEEGGSRGCC